MDAALDSGAPLTPIVGAAYDRTIRTILSDLIRAVIDRPYIFEIEGFGLPARTPTVGAG